MVGGRVDEVDGGGSVGGIVDSEIVSLVVSDEVALPPSEHAARATIGRRARSLEKRIR